MQTNLDTRQWRQMRFSSVSNLTLKESKRSTLVAFVKGNHRGDSWIPLTKGQ